MTRYNYHAHPTYHNSPPVPRMSPEESEKRRREHWEAIEKPMPALTHAEWYRESAERSYKTNHREIEMGNENWKWEDVFGGNLTPEEWDEMNNFKGTPESLQSEIRELWQSSDTDPDDRMSDKQISVCVNQLWNRHFV